MYVLGYILYTYLYMSVCIYEFIFVCMYIHIYKYVCMHACTCMYVCVYYAYVYVPPRPLLPSVGFGARRVRRSAARGEFLIPRARLAIMQRRAFSVVGPSAWNDLPFELRSLLMAHPSKFYISLKS